MLTTRLWMGSVLIALTLGVLIFDRALPHYPFQFAFLLFLVVLGCRELLKMLGPSRPVHRGWVFCGLGLLTITPWLFDGGRPWQSAPPVFGFEFVVANLPTWAAILGLVTVLQLAIFLAELRTFTESGGAFERMARTWWVISYLGLLPTFFSQIRWIYPWKSELGTSALALAIFVPKCCDIGAYFTGRFLGRHLMTPVLSPKKTWEGALGGLIFCTMIAICIDRFGPAPVLHESLLAEIGFGVSVGMMGMLGDLAESLIKRDCQQKDASQAVPGFGGVLDVVDAVIFSAPLSYAWFLAIRASEKVAI